MEDREIDRSLRLEATQEVPQRDAPVLPLPIVLDVETIDGHEPQPIEVHLPRSLVGGALISRLALAPHPDHDHGARCRTGGRSMPWHAEDQGDEPDPEPDPA